MCYNVFQYSAKYKTFWSKISQFKYYRDESKDYVAGTIDYATTGNQYLQQVKKRMILNTPGSFEKFGGVDFPRLTDMSDPRIVTLFET